MATHEQIITEDLENTRENARKAVNTLNELQGKLERTRSQKSKDLYQNAIDGIHTWLNEHGHEIRGYGIAASYWHLVPTSEEQVEMDARLRYLRTRRYVESVADKQKEVVSRLQSLKREVDWQLQKCQEGNWNLGTNALSASAREIELCYKYIETTQQIVMEIGDLKGLADPLP